jgi:hypothetical protein
MTLTTVLLPCAVAGAPGATDDGAAVPATGGVDGATVVPHFEQNFAPSDNGAPQFTQNAAMARLPKTLYVSAGPDYRNAKCYSTDNERDTKREKIAKAAQSYEAF